MIPQLKKRCAMRSMINSYHERITANTPAKVRQGYRERQIEHFINYSPIGNTMIGKWLKRSFHYLYKIYVIIKYTIFQVMDRLYRDKWQLAFRITFVGMALFILSEKQINFSVNTKSPLLAVRNAGAGVLRTGAKFQQVSLKETESSPRHRSASIEDLDPEQVEAYIKRFTRVATVEMEKFGIPASLKMAQGIVDSWAGKHPVSSATNNHFGRPLAGKLYKSAWENWRAHSLYLNQHYQNLFDNGRNYRKWAEALAQSGYTEDQDYYDKLMTVIENYQLYLLDEV